MDTNKERLAIEDFFKKTFKDKPFLSGFLRQGSRVCGKDRCRCHAGKLHPTRVLHGYYKNGKHYLRSIPEDKAEAADDAIRRYKLFLEVLEEHGHDCRRKLFPRFYSPLDWSPRDAPRRRLRSI